jgi:hypothetical protein
MRSPAKASVASRPPLAPSLQRLGVKDRRAVQEGDDVLGPVDVRPKRSSIGWAEHVERCAAEIFEEHVELKTVVEGIR